MLPRGSSLVGCFIVFAFASGASAQCAEGRIPTAEGTCCWGGQTGSDGRCVGPPSCPDPLVAEGDTCVPRMLAAPAPRAAPAVAEPAVVAAPAALTAPPEIPTVMSIRHQLVGLGATHLAIGWTGSAVIASIYAAGGSFGPNCRSSYGPIGWVPVLGALIAAAAIDACAPPWDATLSDWAMLGAATAVQAVGLVLVLVGFYDRRPVSRPVELTASGVTIRF